MSGLKDLPPAALSLSPLTQATGAGRWRTEAMRSHRAPRLIVVNRGQGRITIAGLTKGFGPNNAIFIPANTMYGYEAGPTVFGNIITIPQAMAQEWPEAPVHMRLRDVAAQKEFSLLLDALERELKDANGDHSRAAHYHLGLLSVFFERQLEGTDGLDAIGESTAARLVAAYTDLADREFHTGKGVAEFAANLGITPTHLTRCCKQTCGRSALDLLTDRRIYEACRLLRDTKVPVQDISKDLGFSSAAYFSRAFQHRIGKSPSVFRKTGAGSSTQEQTPIRVRY